MANTKKILSAYAKAASLRNQRDQDAEVFRRVSNTLRQAASDLARARAIADARQLWQTVLVASQDPSNPMTLPLRAQIVSVAQSVLRVIGQEQPDLGFVVQINEHFADGLSGVP